MRVRYHPEFARDLVQFTGQYRAISPRLGARFRLEVNEALERIKAEPTATGHFVNTGSAIVKEVRRRNLVSFPQFVLYGVSGDLLVIAAVIPSASDPLTWLERF